MDSMGTALPRMDEKAKKNAGHPYGVEPMGNMFMSGNPSNCRLGGLGTLSTLDDERMLHLMTFMDASTLCRLASVSRALYVFSHVDELWKTMVVEEMERHPGETVRPHGAWKDTYAFLRQRSAGAKEATFVAHIPVKVPGFFSDLLFQPHHCATTPIRPEWLERSTVDRKAGLSAEEFRREYEESNLPVVLTDGAARWPALEKWTRNQLLSKHGDLRLHAGGLEFELKDYLRYAEESRDELPLYVFDKHFADKCPELGQDYTVPDAFPEDLFAVLGSERRPDHRWLIAGPARSGSSFHVDPNRTSAWNVTVCGRKKWIMFPPGETPPGVHPSEDGLDLAAPVSLMEWFLNFYEECHAPERRVPPLECVVGPGEVVFVPTGWWHCVLNLEWSVAITQNYVSSVNLRHVIRFLLNQKHLISGLPVEEREDLGDRFVAALASQRPDLGAPYIADRCRKAIPRGTSTDGCGNGHGRSQRFTRKARPGSDCGTVGDNAASLEDEKAKKAKLWERLAGDKERGVVVSREAIVSGYAGGVKEGCKGQPYIGSAASGADGGGFRFDFSLA